MNTMIMVSGFIAIACTGFSIYYNFYDLEPGKLSLNVSLVGVLAGLICLGLLLIEG